jgi:WD40 repeat protein
VIKLWNKNLKKGTRVFNANRDSAEQMAFADDGRRLVITGTVDDYNIRVWDFETDKCILQLAGHKEMQYTLGAPPKTGDTRLLSGSVDGEVRLYV